MNYYSILNLTKEPFSNSPDPDFFFQSREHYECLQKLELSLHLRRGLNVVIGDVGTGKTTLCRQIIRRFTQRPENETHLILDPSFASPLDFLTAVAKIVSGNAPPKGTPEAQIKEFIKQSLFKKGVDQNKTMIMIIDEGQKIPPFCLELLREFLNYETNEFKLLQIVIFAQKEFEATVGKYPNFADRINLYHVLKPLDFRDTRLMINYRIEKSSSSPHRSSLFTYPALLAIYRATGGYPRKIINLCHQCILAMIIQNRRKVGYLLVRKCAHRVFRSSKAGWLRPAAAAVAIAAAVLVALTLAAPERVRPLLPEQLRRLMAWSGPAPQAPEPAPPAGSGAPTETHAAARLTPVEPKLPPPAAAEKKVQSPVDTPVESQQQPPAAEAETASAVAAAKDTIEEKEQGPAEENPSPPDLLGTVAIEKNETLSGLIHSVYGEYNSRFFRLLILANPGVDDPDRVPVGQRIALPAVPLEVTAPPEDIWWVKLGEESRLEPALNRLRQYPEAAPAVRMISYWTPEKGTRFALVLKQVFTSPQAAGMQVKLLPPLLADRGRVVSSWGTDAVYFSDPFPRKYRAE